MGGEQRFVCSVGHWGVVVALGWAVRWVPISCAEPCWGSPPGRMGLTDEETGAVAFMRVALFFQ